MQAWVLTRRKAAHARAGMPADACMTIPISLARCGNHIEPDFNQQIGQREPETIVWQRPVAISRLRRGHESVPGHYGDQLLAVLGDTGIYDCSDRRAENNDQKPSISYAHGLQLH